MYDWIDSDAALAGWLDKHPAGDAVALDTEFMRTNTFAARLALVQVGCGDGVALIDAVALPQPPRLAAALARRTCVMHSAAEDLEALRPLLPEGPGELFDTQIAAALVGLGYGLSYGKLVAQLFGVELAKAETRSDWLQRPLSAAQLEYAALDVHWLPRLHETLAQRLDSLGRREWLREDCRGLVSRICHPQPDTQPQRALRGAADWPIERQAQLRRLLVWREAAARRLDKPRPWLLDDAHALDLAARPPASGEELFERTRGLRALRGPQREELLSLLKAPLADDIAATVPIPPAPTPAQKRALGEMKQRVATIAASLDLPEGLLASRRHLEALLLDAAWPPALEGWRRPLLEEALSGAMP
jgi:ribonuclease D